MDEVDIVFLVAVNPGFPAQKFIESTKTKIEKLKIMVRQVTRPPMIGLDGGITRLNIAEMAAMGADVIVTGSAIFDGKPAENIAFMRNALKKQEYHGK